jgi:hypothetical protein
MIMMVYTTLFVHGIMIFIIYTTFKYNFAYTMVYSTYIGIYHFGGGLYYGATFQMWKSF